MFASFSEAADQAGWLAALSTAILLFARSPSAEITYTGGLIKLRAQSGGIMNRQNETRQTSKTNDTRRSHKANLNTI